MSTRNVQENLTSPISRPLVVSALAVVLYVFGFILILTAALFYSGSNSLVFILSGFGVFPLSHDITGLVVITIGLVNIAAGVGVQRLSTWGLVLGLAVSLVEIIIGIAAGDFTSFIFIRGAITLVGLLAIRRYFVGLARR